MADRLDELERRIEALRADVRRATLSGDAVRAREIRVELRQVEQAWDQALVEASAPQADVLPPAAGAILPVREQVHQALTLLRAPAAPKLIVAVHEALFGGGMLGARLTSLRRDEERSFRSAPHARPYYVCSALTADRLVPARGLLAVSTWSLASRMIGPLSPRVDFLTAAAGVAEQVGRMIEPTLPARSLLWRFASNIPGAAASFDEMKAPVVADAANTELAVHLPADQKHREEAASRARTQLDETQQLFGSALKVVSRTES